MAKYSLLTTLSLNAAGFTSGLDRAKKSTQQFKQGTENASRAIAGSFKNMGGVLGGAVNSQIGMLGQSIQGGVSAFRTMIPAINGVKMALIASGIGAIVVAIGLAFAALSSYLTGTKEGSDKLNVIMGYLKGTMNAIIQRVNLMGSALMKLFQGDFKGMTEDFKEAFKGGLFDEIKSSASQYVAFAQEQNKLKEEKLALDSAEVELQAKMAEFQTDAKNKLLSISERQKKQTEFKKLDAQLDERKQKYLYADWQLQEKINKSKGKSISYSDLELVNSKKKAYYDELTKDAQEQVTVNKIDFQLQSGGEKLNSISDLEDKIKKGLANGENVIPIIAELKIKQANEAEADRLYEQLMNPVELNLKLSEDATDEIFDQINEELKIEPITFDPKPIIQYGKLLQEQLFGIQGMTNLAAQAINGLGQAFVDMAKGSEVSFKDMIGSMLDGLRSVIYGLLAEALATTIINALNPKNPANQMSFGLAGIAAAAIGITAVSALWAKLPKFATGGIIKGSSFSGDKQLARVNAGEMILNQSQQRHLFQMANGGSNWGVGGEVRFEIEGDKLVGVLSRHNKRVSSYR